jgi:hypothetical protein
LSTNKPSRIFAIWFFFAIALPYTGSAYSVEKNNLDVNLNPIYISVRPHRAANVQSEIVFQVPLPLTAKAEATGLGPIGSIAYFDHKSLIHIESEAATVRGVGRLYYVSSAYGTKHTVVPYITLYRDFVIDYKNSIGKSFQSKSKTWMPPGILYAYRMNDKMAMHFEAELYNYTRPANNTSRIGLSYALSQQWVVSGSYERLAWDMKDDTNSNIFMNGSSNNIYLKLMSSKPLKDNFAFILGYAVNKNTAGPALQQKSMSHTRGVFLGVEASLGTLVW